MKKAIRLAVGVVGLGLLMGADWPGYRGPTNDGVSVEKIAKGWPAGGPKVIWKVAVPEGLGTFAVRGKQAFYFGAKDGEEVCFCLDAGTAKMAWAMAVGTTIKDKEGTDGGGNCPRSTPVVEGDRVYVLSSKLRLVCMNAADGKIVWSHDLIQEFGGKNIQWFNAASPVVAGGNVIVAGGGDGQAMMGFEKASGKVAWKTGTDVITHATPTVASIGGVKQVIFFLRSGLVAVDPMSGKELWRHPFKFNVSTAASPVVGGEVVYCSEGYSPHSTAVKITKSGGQFTATPIWDTKDPGPLSHWSTPVYHNGYMYGMFTFKKHKQGPMKCVEMASGKVMWEQAGFGPGGVVLVDGHILATGDQGQVVLVEASPKAYHEVARTQPLQMQGEKDKVWSAPVLSDGKVFVHSTQEAACLDLSGK